jgi:hypothetical protein
MHDISLQKLGVERSSGPGSIGVNPPSSGAMYTVANRRAINHMVPMAGLLGTKEIRPC